jgi:hypothetical protein
MPTPPADWSFDRQSIEADGDMTLVLARRRGAKLEGAKVEFAKDATLALREMIDSTIDRLELLERRTYEPSLAITEHEYLAVPDELVARAAPPVQPKSTQSSEADRSNSKKSSTPPVEHIETDPQVRAFLRDASGLPLVSAADLARKPPFLFYAVVVGSTPGARAAFVRKKNPVRSLGPGAWFSFGERLVQVTEPLLGLDDHFDLVVMTNGIAVINQGVFDALFRDAETLVARFPLWAKAFSTIGLDRGQVDDLVRRCRSDSRLGTRLRQIHESGHLAAGEVGLEQVLSEADKVAGGRERFLKNGKLDFNGPDVSSLLKLLNDDLFVGGLSKQTFEAGSKARV